MRRWLTNSAQLMMRKNTAMAATISKNNSKILTLKLLCSVCVASESTASVLLTVLDAPVCAAASAAEAETAPNTALPRVVRGGWAGWILSRRGTAAVCRARPASL